MTVRTLQSEEAQESWRIMLDMVQAGEEVVIEQQDKPFAVMVGYEQWQSLKQAQFLALLDQRSREMDEDPAMAIPWDDVKLNL